MMIDPEVLTALATIIGALAVLATSIGALIVSIRTSKQVEVVHRVVNSRATAQDDRIEQLSASLTSAGVMVPDKPSRAVLVPPETVVVVEAGESATEAIETHVTDGTGSPVE